MSTRSVYVTITAQVFFDDDEIQQKLEENASGEEMTEQDAINVLATESVSDFMPLSEDVLKVRDIVVDLSTLS